MTACGLRTVEDLWGFCRTCYYADVCRAGCTWTSHSLLGRPGNNPYCHYRALTLEGQGLRERIVKTRDAPDRSFAIGEFEVVTEPIPEGTGRRGPAVGAPGAVGRPGRTGIPRRGTGASDPRSLPSLLMVHLARTGALPVLWRRRFPRRGGLRRRPAAPSGPRGRGAASHRQGTANRIVRAPRGRGPMARRRDPPIA